MKASPTKTTVSKPTGAPGRVKAGPTALSFSDLEIPVRPLLNHAQEQSRGMTVQVALGRLAEWLPQQPAGYRRYLMRMREVSHGGGLMFSWITLRERMADDLRKATRALERAEKAARAGDEEAAWKALQPGVRVLKTYPLDLETLYQWSRDIAEGQRGESELDHLDRARRRGRLIARTVSRLEEARDGLVMPNLRLVLKEVFRFRPTGMRRSDLFQEGVLGLQKASFRYDPSLKTRFSTYATYWIRQSIRKSLTDKARLIRVPQGVQEQLRKEDSRLSQDELDRVRRIMNEPMLFSAAEGKDSGGRSNFVVPDRSAPESTEALHTETIPRAVADALSDLGGREREVLLRRFGLDGEQPQTLEEIGSRMNLSRERIRQIERHALQRMQKVSTLRELFEDLGAALAGGPASRN